MQDNLKASKNLSDRAAKILIKRMKYACSARWLSFDRSVQVVKQEYKSLLHVMEELTTRDGRAYYT